MRRREDKFESEMKREERREREKSADVAVKNAHASANKERKHSPYSRKKTLHGIDAYGYTDENETNK